MAGPTLGTAYVQVVASARGIKGSITNAISGEASTAGTKAGSLIGGKLKGALMAAGIGTALVAGFKSAIQETGALQQSYLGGIDTLYGEAAEKAREYAMAAQEAGISQSNYSEQAVSFGAALKQAYGGDTKQALEAANTAILDMADNSAKMGTPLESIQDAYQGFARGQYQLLDNLKLGYGGTKGEMERLLADAQKITGVEYDIDNLGDVYEAIHVIQGELGLTGVAAEEAQSTLTGSFEGMKAAWQNLLGNIGLGENVESSMGVFVDSVSNYLFNNLIPTIGTIFKSLPKAMGAFIKKGAPQIAKSGMGLIKSLANGAQKQLPQLLQKLIKGITGLTKSFGSNMGKFIEVGSKLILSVAKGLVKALPKLLQAAPKIVSNIVIGIVKNLPKILAVGVKLIGTLALGIIKAIPSLIAVIPRIISRIRQAFNVNWGAIGKKIISGIGSGISAAIGVVKSAINKVKNAITSPINAAKNTVKNTIKKIKGFFPFSISKFISGLPSNPLSAIYNKIKGVVNKIKGFFPLSVGKIFSNIKVPKISVSGGKAPFGIGGKGTRPSIKVTWNAKAMENPYLFSDATLFGAGETGDEVLYGRSALMRDISEASSNSIDYERLGYEVAKAFVEADIKTIVNLDGKAIARGTAKSMRQELNTIDTRTNRTLGFVGV